MPMKTSGLSFGKFPHSLCGPPEGELNGRTRLLLVSPSDWSYSENCPLLAQFGKLPLGGTTPARTQKWTLSRWESNSTPKKGCLHPPCLPYRRRKDTGKQLLCSLLHVRRTMLKDGEKVKESHPTTGVLYPSASGNKDGFASARGTFQCGSFLAAGKIAPWPHNTLLFWHREEGSFTLAKLDLSANLPELCPLMGIKQEWSQS